ncbi:PREDICTED: UPF0481 protein At3g47200-like [Nelumbo nucifera]|uniref:UPF0481 protein At3g47200-like n=2 Tax=Nelumbo nucifera TaxID=4432 RepID=A0A1U7YU41_NELNU|nr:PREDICTED: UPF0481 protein At3g47200-like [Nelumbo nucifera]DAD25189.1 TPA_asm: hypothetical protein HUJ06_026653 [Nelumbo nucifera]
MNMIKKIVTESRHGSHNNSNDEADFAKGQLSLVIIGGDGGRVEHEPAKSLKSLLENLSLKSDSNGQTNEDYWTDSFENVGSSSASLIARKDRTGDKYRNGNGEGNSENEWKMLLTSYRGESSLGSLSNVRDVESSVIVEKGLSEQTSTEIEEEGSSRRKRLARMDGSTNFEVADSVLLAAIKNKVELSSARSTDCCIYRIPNTLRKTNEKAYVPEIISIGPFHRCKENLGAMEEHKQWYLKALLSRTTDPDKILDDCIKAMRALEANARKCYSEPIDYLSSDEFVEMMLVDGCFMIELFFRYSEQHLEEQECLMKKNEVKLDQKDPIFSSERMLPTILRDMLLLENQLPFFVLEWLFDIIIAPVKQKSVSSLNQLVFNFFANVLPMGGMKSKDRTHLKGEHLLHLLRRGILPSSAMRKPRDIQEPEITHCVTELREAGVKFKKKDKADSFMDITFSNGVVEIPNLNVQDYTNCLFRNLIAFEQCYHSCTSRITSYAYLMDSLIDTPEDVQYLKRRRIITHLMGNHEEVSFLFNNLCNGVYLNHFYYVDLCEQVNAHFRSRWHTWRASLMRDYFKNPWAVLSFTAAILLLALTFIGALFSTLSFCLHHS